MGLFNSLTNKTPNQFLDVIECNSIPSHDLVRQFRRCECEIKYGAKLIVRQDQEAVFFHDGKVGDIFKPGEIKLTPHNLPLTLGMTGYKYNINSSIKCDIYFVNTQQFDKQIFSVESHVWIHEDSGVWRLPFRARGNYYFKVSDPPTLINYLGTAPKIETKEITDLLHSDIARGLSRVLDEVMGGPGIRRYDLSDCYSEIADYLCKVLNADFDKYGITLSKINIENISVGPAHMQEIVRKHIRMGIGKKSPRRNTPDDQAATESPSDNINAVDVQPSLPGFIAGPWYIGVNGEQLGPLYSKAIIQKIQEGILTQDTLVWKLGMATWVKASEAPDLSLFMKSLSSTLPPDLST